MAGYETEFENFIYFFCVLFASCLIAEGFFPLVFLPHFQFYLTLL